MSVVKKGSWRRPADESASANSDQKKAIRVIILSLLALCIIAATVYLVVSFLIPLERVTLTGASNLVSLV